MPKQSEVHGKGKRKKVDPVRKQYSRAVKQVVDSLAPGANPRRTKNRFSDMY
jgi:hypothetical protein